MLSRRRGRLIIDETAFKRRLEMKRFDGAAVADKRRAPIREDWRSTHTLSRWDDALRRGF
jgi:hypothetical protein